MMVEPDEMSAMQEMKAEGEYMKRIPEELSGKHIFVTGGTGFMGKVLLEKLLRACPDIACIYVLMRSKKGLNLQERINAITATELFKPLLKTNPGVVSKLRAVRGDCSELGLGLSADDEAMLVDNVSYVFHAAATVRFDDPLKSALLLNTRGTREMINLCKKMKKIKVLEYVSTTYCFTNEAVLKEQPYKTDIDWRTMIHLAETEDRNTLDAFSRKILGFQPNTYTFSKALAENCINDARNEVPVIIFRPAVVINSLCEPFRGWLDNLNGPFSIWAGVLKGVLRYSYGNPNVALSYTPVDWAIRGMIVVAMAKAFRCPTLRTQASQVDVINAEGSIYDRNTFETQNRELTNVIQYGVNPIRYPRYVLTNNYLEYWLGTLLSSLPYGFVIDILLCLAGMKPRMIAIYRKIIIANDALAYFMLNEFPIETGKIFELHHQIHVEDLPSFGTMLDDKRSCLYYDREGYSTSLIQGTYKYALKETCTVEETVARLKKLYVLEIVINTLCVYLMYLLFGNFFLTKLRSVASIFG